MPYLAMDNSGHAYFLDAKPNDYVLRLFEEKYDGEFRELFQHGGPVFLVELKGDFAEISYDKYKEFVVDRQVKQEAEIEAEDQRTREEKERREYERLKKKFGTERQEYERFKKKFDT